MIAGIFHQGSGLGNQLHRYVMTRVVAEDLGYDWGMMQPDLFKGSSFMDLDTGESVYSDHPWNFFTEERVNNVDGVDVRGYDWGIKSILDNTVIDGEFQGEEYFNHKKDEIRDWLKVEELSVPNDVCIIGFRGGEYAFYPDLFLPVTYWDKAIRLMKEINPKMKFKVVTDDPETAKLFFPKFEITHEIGMDWRQVRYAKYLIVANSSFYILPALLNQNLDKIIAPKHWARHNKGFWALPQNEYKGWTYI